MQKVSAISGIGLQDKEDNSIYLPMNMSIRNCHSTYLYGIGYEVKNFGDGNYHVKWKGEGEKVQYALLMTFYSIWKHDFPHIKVSSAIEDICKY